MTDTLFNLSDVSFNYGTHPALRRISFSLEKGECVSIIGPNGSGKTTLLSILSGIQKPSEGRVLFHGRPLSRHSFKELARMRSVSFVQSGLLPAFTVRQYLEQRQIHKSGGLFSFAAGRNTGSIEYAVSITGIENLLDKKLTGISSGELQLVSIAGAVVQSKELILLDEPSSHLDIRHTQEVYNLISKLHNEGTTVISVLHDINAAISLSTRIIALKDGNLLFDGGTARFVESGISRNIFSVEFICSKNPVTGDPYLFAE